METKKIGDYAQERGVSMALHMAGPPISTLASVHCAAATQPEGPGLGFELNLDVVREHLVPWDRGFFAPTPEWDDVRTRDRLWS